MLIKIFPGYMNSWSIGTLEKYWKPWNIILIPLCNFLYSINLGQNPDIYILFDWFIYTKDGLSSFFWWGGGATSHIQHYSKLSSTYFRLYHIFNIVQCQIITFFKVYIICLIFFNANSPTFGGLYNTLNIVQCQVSFFFRNIVKC